MLDLFLAKFGDCRRQIGIAGAERFELRAIMAIDLGLDRGGAGHRRFGAEQSGTRAERETGDVP
jgi:hypothetical protein